MSLLKLGKADDFRFTRLLAFTGYSKLKLGIGSLRFENTLNATYYNKNNPPV